jgi:hypothetical protein
LKEHGFTVFGKTLPGMQEVSGHNFTVFGKTLPGMQEVSGHNFTVFGKTLPGMQEVSGHDFSRAANGTKQIRALAPEGCIARLLMRMLILSTACNSRNALSP